MDFLNVIVNFLSAAVIVYGGGMAAGGWIIICVGLFLIPKIATLFPTA